MTNTRYNIGEAKMARIYILNTLIIPFQGDQADFKIRKVSIEEAREILRSSENVISAVGHKATADLLSMLLEVPVQTNRIAIYFDINDEAVAFVLKQRLPEGKVIQTRQELEQIGYDLYYIKRVA